MLIEQGQCSAQFEFHSSARIISLVPSLSWYIQDLCDHKSLIGITKFCVPQPEKWVPSNIIGGTKTPDLIKIRDLKPDLILANKEENNKGDIEFLAEQFPVYVSSVSNLSEMYQMMMEIGSLCHQSEKALNCIQRIKTLHEDFYSTVNKKSSISVCYLIWRNPYMTIGKDTFIHSVIEMMGCKNVFENCTRYPTVNLEQINEAKPHYVLLSSEPYPFKTKHLSAFLPLKSELVDGRMFSWYGSYMEKSFSYLKALNLKMTQFYE